MPAAPSASKTTVTLLLSGTANDQLSGFEMTLTSLTLTNKGGNTVSVFNAPLKTEFIHLNGTAEPLLTVSVPQGSYAAATATVGYAQFTCVTLNSSASIQSSTFAYGQTPSNQVTVNLRRRSRSRGVQWD